MLKNACYVEGMFVKLNQQHLQLIATKDNSDWISDSTIKYI